MVNHYASLLLNLPGANSNAGSPSYFTGRDYNPIVLPVELQKFYDLLFPSGTSTYQKQFLCYSYLRVLNSSGLTDLLTSYDSRITYDLDSLNEYFRTPLISPVISSDPAFSMFVSGVYTTGPNNNYYYNSYTITQLGYSPSVVVFSNVDGVYLKGITSSPAIDFSVSIELVEGSTPSMTAPVPIGQSGLSFIIDLSGGTFTSSPNKCWSFLAEAPFEFKFIELFNTLQARNAMVDGMLQYGGLAAGSNENIWNNHFNSVYRLAGLLNAYISRVNSLTTNN